MTVQLETAIKAITSQPSFNLGYGQFIDMYNYNIPGQVVTKRLQFNQTVQWPQGSPATEALNLDAGYTYDNEGTMTGMSYPATVLLLDSVGTLNVYFRGKKVATGQPGALVAFQQDRLGSSVKTYPYGEEKVPNGVDGWKFATYLRDTATNLDYADQRFYANTSGRFLTPDPYAASGGAGDPGSWNRYAYVAGDPINFNDPDGLMAAATEGEFTFTTTVFATATGDLPDFVLLALLTRGQRSPDGRAYDIFGWYSGPSAALKRAAATLAKDQGDDDCDSLAKFADLMGGFIDDGPYANNQFVRSFGVLTPSRGPLGIVTSMIQSVSDKDVVTLQTPGQASGFASQFRNNGPGENPDGDQSHHFAAFFQLGYWYGSGPGGAAASAWEFLERTSGNTNGVALGRAAAALGAGVRDGSINRNALGQRIRNEICND